MTTLGIIAEQPDEFCVFCGNIDECRPYGPNHENICFSCATTRVDREVVEKRMADYIFGESK